MCKSLENYNKKDEYLYMKQYLYIKGFASGRNYINVLKALPLARKMHDGQYRKGEIIMDGEKVSLPYITHPLKVCSTLISLNLPLSNEELDILYASAILHDVIEDGKFEHSDLEIVTDYGISKRVYDIIKLLSKHQGATQEELCEYFNRIKEDKFALLVKLSDRSHNVEDLYNMKNIHKYVKETKDFIYPLSSYAKVNYPELSNGITILKSKIVSLTESTEVLVDKYESEINKLKQEIDRLKK